MSKKRAPKGGVTIGGVFFKGGRFLPDGIGDAGGIVGLKEVVLSFRASEKLIKTEGTRFLDDLGIWTRGRVKAYTLDAGSVDLGELVQGIHHKTKIVSDGIETTVRPSDKADKYASHVEYGTKPHRPPVKALQGWADRHKIPVWAVVRKIELHGTEPRWMWRDTFDDLDDEVDKRIPRFAEILVRKI